MSNSLKECYDDDQGRRRGHTLPKEKVITGTDIGRGDDRLVIASSASAVLGDGASVDDNGYLRFPPNCENLHYVKQIALDDADLLHVKGETYGDSWKSRGGVGAFMMLARKWDRLENIVKPLGWDIFQAVQDNPEEGGVLDDIRDLRAYLLLVESEMVHRGTIPDPTER